MHPWRFSGKNGHITEFCPCRKEQKNGKKIVQKHTEKKRLETPASGNTHGRKKIDDHRLGGRAGMMCGCGDGLGY